MNKTEPIVKYDESSDALYISFAPGDKGTGVELNDSILLRINKQERRAIGITIFNYSFLAQRTALGPRSLPLTGLAELSNELRALMIEILMQPPVQNFLAISAYTPSVAEIIPITSLQGEALALA
jgi:uncharacterized protein YuzE